MGDATTADLPVVSVNDSDSDYEIDDPYDDFTITQCRSKSSVDQRARAKEKKKNYQFKATEDVDWTRAAVRKEVPKEVLESIGSVLAVGSEAVIFNAVAVTEDHIYQGRKIRKTFARSVTAVLKVWNKPCKAFLDSRRQYFENDAEFLEILNNSNVVDFQSIWAKREHDNLVKMAGVGISCPKILYFDKNVIILSLDPTKFQFKQPQKTLDKVAEEWEKSSTMWQVSFEQVAQTMSDMFEKCGLVHADLNATNILEDGSIIDVAQAMDKSLPKALDFLFKDCRNICEFYNSHGLQLELCNPENLFEKITGFEFQGVTGAKSESDVMDIESRKLERKSQRFVTNSKGNAI